MISSSVSETASKLCIHSTWGSYTVSVEVLCPFPLSSSYVASCFSVCVLCLSAPVFFPTQCSNNVTFQAPVTGKRKHKYFRKLSKTLKLMFLFMRKIDKFHVFIHKFEPSMNGRGLGPVGKKGGTSFFFSFPEF